MRALFDMHLFNSDMCKLIGEYAGFDVSLLRGETYYTLCSGRASYIHNNTYKLNTLLGTNRYVRIDYLERLIDVFSQVTLNIQNTIWKESLVCDWFKRVFKFIHLSTDTVADDSGALIITYV